MSILMDDERIQEQLTDLRDAIADEGSHDLSDLSDRDLENIVEAYIQIKVDYLIEDLIYLGSHDRREFLERIESLRKVRANARARRAA